jgi:hypothetical protein
MTDRQPGERTAPGQSRICVYVSRPAPGLAIEDVRALVFEARGFNAINGITGLLTYDRRGFLQAVEGMGEAIDELIATIARDPRHSDMDVILDGPAWSRQFASFHDFICEGDRLASLALLQHATLARLSGDIAGAIGQGFARL